MFAYIKAKFLSIFLGEAISTGLSFCVGIEWKGKSKEGDSGLCAISSCREGKGSVAIILVAHLDFEANYYSILLRSASHLQEHFFAKCKIIFSTLIFYRTFSSP